MTDMVADPITRFARGELSAAMTVSLLLLAHRDCTTLRRELAARPGDAATTLLALLDAHAAGAEQALAILERADTAQAGAASIGDRLERCRRLFDEAVAVNPAASVALYSLGDVALLRAATEEAVALMSAVGLLGRDHDLLDFGCGIGRLALALAGRVRSVTGVDLSPAMLAAARERCAGLSHLRFLASDGRDLAMLADAAFDAAIAVDSVPYLYEAGGAAFARAQLGEIARVLRPGGRVLVLNLSYRNDPAVDRSDAAGFAADLGLTLERNGTADLRSWDGLSFLFAKPL